MEEVVKMIIDAIMDALAEFFDALTVPTRRYTLDALIVAVIFLGVSILTWLFDIFTFVSWQEALVCTLLLCVIVLIDSSARSAIKSSLSKIKDATSKIVYTGEEDEDEEDFDEDEDDEDEDEDEEYIDEEDMSEEVIEDEQGE